jgi:DNA-binding transcriptional LysR family regulator
VSYISLFPLNQETWPFVNEELALFVHTTHPLAQREKVELIDLRNENFILFNQELIYNLIIQECLRAGFRPKTAYEISEWGFISEMIGENIGISICPKPIAKKVNQDLIKVISIDLYQKKENICHRQFVNLSSISQLNYLFNHEKKEYIA